MCWPYADVDDLLSGVATYLSDGPARGDHAARSGAPAVVVHHPPPSVAIVLDALGMPRMRVGASR